MAVSSQNFLGGIVGLIVLVIVAGTLFNFDLEDTEQDTRSQSDYSPSWIFPVGNANEGDTVINRGDVEVRQQIGGAIIGTQKNRYTGEILDGPVEKFGLRWWRINYRNAPDGWVEESQITSRVGLFRTVNILPILYNNLIKPVGVILTLITIVLFFVVRFLYKGALAHEEKLQRMRKEKAVEYYQPEIKETTQVVDENVDVPSNLPTGDTAPDFEHRITANAKNERWVNVQKLMESHSENDWKQAILEADVILESMIDRMGYEGPTLLDRLNQIEPSDFITLESAIQANRIKTKIEHSGVEFRLSKEEADRTIGMYEEVFKEFYYI